MSIRRIALTASLLGALTVPSAAAFASEVPSSPVIALAGDEQEVRVLDVTVLPSRVAPGDRIDIRGEVSGAAPGTEIFVFVGGLPTEPPLVLDDDGVFAGAIEAPADLTNGPADVSVGLGDGTVFSVDIITVAVSTGIDLTDQIAGEDDAPPVDEATETPAADVVPETELSDSVPADEVTAAPDTGLGDTLLTYLPWVLGVAVATALLFGIMAVTRRRGRRGVTGGDRFDVINHEPADAGPVAEDGSLDTWVGETRAAGERGASYGTIAEALSTIQPSVRDPKTEYSVVEMTERIRSNKTEETELAANLTMDHAQRVAREARDHHVPSSTEVETWWVIRRGSDQATVWIAHSWSEREYHVDPDTGAMETEAGGGRPTGVV